MGFGLGSKRRSHFQSFREATALALVLPLVLPPRAQAAGPAPTSWSLPTQANQGNLQKSAGNANSTGQMLGQAMGVVSMGLGGLYMAKGAQQLSCCASGCSGSGTESQAAKNARDINNQNEVKDKFGNIVPKTKLKLDLPSKWLDGVRNECPQPRMPAPRGGLFSLLAFFQPPQEAQAAGGCIDAMIALATGGLMMLQGLMSLNAANQAGQNAGAAYGNADNMGSYPGANGTSPTPGSENNGKGKADLGGTGKSGELVKIDPALLHTGKANDIMGQFEQKFGMNRDDFAKSVLNGEDPRKLLSNAPRNALSNADMNKATQAAKAMSDSEKAAALAGTGLSDAQKELLARLNGAGSPENEIKTGGASGALSRMTASKKADEELDELKDAAKSELAVSPELQAALDAKEKSDRANGITDQTIFQVVHAKYREKAKMIFGYDPDGIPKGVGDANGL